MILVLIYYGIVVFLVYKWIEWRIKNREMIQKASKLLGPTLSLPLIGHAYYFVGKDNEGIFSTIQMLLSKYKSPAKIWIGPILCVLVDRPEDFQIVLNSQNCLEKSDVYKFIQIERGLLTASTNIWKIHRKNLNPSFNLKLLQSFIPIFNKKSKILIREMGKHVNGATFDVYKLISACTLDMILSTSLGSDFGIQENKETDYLESIEDFMSLATERIVKPWLHPGWIYRLTRNYRQVVQARRVMHQMSDKVIEQKRRKLRNEIRKEEGQPQIYIDQIFEVAQTVREFDREAIQDELDTIIIAGNDTSALTVSYVLLMLAIHPEIQEKVVEELREVFQNRKKLEVTNEDLQKLVYMEMVIKETLRHFPVGPLVGRKAMDDIYLSNFIIPKGAQIILAFYSLHQNRDIWGPNVRKFDPDNFLPERCAERHPYSFLPFSAGPRNCIGLRYGWLSMKTMLSHLLLNFRFTTELVWDELRPSLSLTLKLSNKHLVQVTKR